MRHLRNVNSNDCDTLYWLVNDVDVRSNSFNCKHIKYTDHQNWFEKKIQDNNCFMYIAEKEDCFSGQIRLDIEGNSGIISFSVHPDFRESGVGTWMLSEIIELWKKNTFRVPYLTGYTKKSNIASQKAFIKAGFIEKELEDMFSFWFPEICED